MGTDNPASHLDENDVRQIRKYLAERKSQRWIAEQFSVSKTTIANIAHRRIWKHV